jgi:carbamoyl-phosphate synthase large subunit
VLMAREVGFPLVVRPSYVLGGRAMEVVFNEDDLRQYMTDAVKVSNDSPVLLDRFLDLAIEVDVDAVSDGEDVLIGGIMEHIEQAGVHSGDSGCSLPPNGLSKEIQDELRAQTRKLAKALNVVGLMNVQFAIQSGVIYMLEVNPRASRTVPFVSKATGIPLAKVAARVMTGKSLANRADRRAYSDLFLGQRGGVPVHQVPGSRSDPGSRDEIHRRGDGHGSHLRRGLCQGASASGVILPTRGLCFVSVRDRDKPGAVQLAQMLIARGFEIAATGGTARCWRRPASPAAASTKCARVARTSSI